MWRVTAPNPNWPLVTSVVDFTTGPPNVPGVNAMSINSAVRRNAVQQIGTTRGRQYELDQVQAGTATLTVTDPLEYLNPANTTSPYNTSGNTITSYRCCQVGGWWNAATGNTAGNMLNTANQIPGQPWLGGLGAAAPYGYDPSFEGWNIHQRPSTGGTSIVSGLPSTALNSNTGFESGISPWITAGGTVTQSSTQKHSGSFSARNVPTGSAAQDVLASEEVVVVPGRQYTVTGWVWVTTAVTANMSLSVVWYDTFSVISVSTTTVSVPATTWTQISATVTAPAGCAFGQIQVILGGTPAASNIWYLDDVSLANFPAPSDGAGLQVWAMTFATASDFGGWRPRYVVGQSYLVQCDVWAPTGTQVQLAWNGSAGLVQTTITGNNAYQTVSISFTPTATDVANGKHWFLAPVSSGSYPLTVYLSKIITLGQVAGFLTSGTPSMEYTPLVAMTGNYSLALGPNSATDSVSLPLPTAPGVTYTFSAFVLVQNTGTGLGATQTINGVSVPTTTVGTFQRLVSTFTAVDAVTLVTWKATSTPYPAVIYLDEIQLEIGSSASAWSATGPTFYPLYTGYVERFPLTWDMHGTLGIRPLTCVDALATLSRTEITQAYATTILTDHPSAYMPLDDAAFPQTVQLPQGGFALVGATATGTNGQVSFAGDTFLDGTPALSISQQNATPPTSGNPAYITDLYTTGGGISLNPQAFTLELWLKVTSGTVYLGAASLLPGETVGGEAAGPTNWLGLYTSAGKLFGQSNFNSVSYFFSGFPGISGYPDGLWHHIAIVLPGANGFHFIVDGIAGGTGTMPGTPPYASINDLFIEATTYFADPQTIAALANVATYNYALTDTQLRNHYNRGTGYLAEVSGTRVLRLLEQYWGNNVVVAPGFRAMAEDYAYATRFMLDVLQEIQETERGLIYVDRYGTVTFDDSTSRYVNYPTSTVTFGENPPGASPVEYPYQDLAQDFDPTYTFSQTNLTRPGNGNFAPLPNPLPTNPPFGQRILSQEVQVTTDFDLVQISTYYLARYAAPVVRIDSLVLNLAANPALFGVVLGLEIGQRITVKRRTSAGLTTSGDYYVEQISHTIDGPASTWTTTLQCSPVFATNAWTCGDSTNGVLGTTTIPVY